MPSAPASPAPGTAEAALYGRDPTPRLVAAHPILEDDRQAFVRLYQRPAEGGPVREQQVPLHPFFFLSDIALLQGFPRERFQFQELAGDNFFRHLVVLPSWPAYWDAIRHVERATGQTQGRPDALYLISNPVQQYFMQSGRTLFKEMTFDDLHRLQLDIEVYSEGAFPNADRPDDAIIIVSMTDNRGWDCVLDARDQSEEALLRQTVHTLQQRDPDVIEGHNIYNFDFPYLMDRCARYGVPFSIGRDGSTPRTFASSMRFAERTIDFTALEIAGRHVVDTYFQVMSFDVFKRDLPGYGLKEAAQYFGFAPEDRTYIAGEDIARTWREDPEQLLRYALDDVIETERLARHLSGSTFYLTQLLPMNYGRVARTGPATKIEALFVREYLRQRHSIPQSEWGSQMMGGYTDIFRTGVLGPIVYADVESLYPSIMLNYDVKPSGDALDIFPRLLQRLTDLRFEAKDQMQEATDDEVVSELDARQSSYKVLINCFDPETEIMTQAGPKNVRAVNVGDLVYALNPETMKADLKPVTHVHTQPHYRGDMVRLKNKHVDLLVTPNHRLLTNRVNGYRQTGYQWREARELFETTCRHQLPPLSHGTIDTPGLPVHSAAWCDGNGSTVRQEAYVGLNTPEAYGTAPVITTEHRSIIPYSGSIHCVTVADHHTVLAGRNGAFNWVGQSFYGNLGFSLAAFNDFAEADRVASTGQKLLRQIIDLIEERGGQVVEADTDGVLFVPPDDVRGDAPERAFVEALNEEMPEGIRIGFDGRYETMLSYKKKNYALLSYDGDLKFKGSSLISRSNEQFGRRFVREAIRLLLNEDIQGLHDLYLATRDRIISHDWDSVRSFSRTETLKDTVEQYQADVEGGKRPRAAAYELAIARAEATGKAVRKGDRISYYITGNKANVTAFAHSKLASKWTPDHPDENTAYYLRRLDQFAQKFESFFREHDFRRIFSPEDLFGFSTDGIEVLVHTHEQTPDDTEVPF